MWKGEVTEGERREGGRDTGGGFVGEGWVTHWMRWMALTEMDEVEQRL